MCWIILIYNSLFVFVFITTISVSLVVLGNVELIVGNGYLFKLLKKNAYGPYCIEWHYMALVRSDVDFWTSWTGLNLKAFSAQACGDRLDILNLKVGKTTFWILFTFFK